MCNGSPSPCSSRRGRRFYKPAQAAVARRERRHYKPAQAAVAQRPLPALLAD